MGLTVGGSGTLALNGTNGNAVQNLTFGGTPTGGTFQLAYQLNFGSVTTTAITFSTTVATDVTNIQAALTAAFGAGNATVAGSSTAGPFTITFNTQQLGVVEPVGGIVNNALVGTAPTASMAVVTPGYLTGSSDLTGIDEQQQVNFTGSPTSGNYQLSFGGATTGAIAFSTAAATDVTAIQTALLYAVRHRQHRGHRWRQ